MTEKIQEIRPLGALIRQYRGARSQDVFAKLVGVKQPTLSAWEKGSTLPAETQLPAIAMHATQPAELAELKMAWEWEAELSLQAPRSIGRILRQAKDYTDRFGRPSAIWAVGPSNLPVLHEPGVVERWRDLLEHGINYKLLWFLDIAKHEDLHSAAGTLNSLSSNLKQREKGVPTGKVMHYATCAFEEPDEAMLRLYAEIVATTEAPRVCEDEPISGMEAFPYLALSATNAGQRMKRATREILKLCHPETAVILYRFAKITTRPVANVRLMPVREALNDRMAADTERPMYWLSATDAAVLDRAIGDFEHAYKAASDEKSRG